MHGDEPQEKYIVEQLMNYIKNNPEIIENAQIMFIPVINPQTPGLFGTYFGKEQNIFVITLETSSEDGYVAWLINTGESGLIFSF